MKNHRFNPARLRDAMTRVLAAPLSSRDAQIREAVALVEAEFSFNERRRALYNALAELPDVTLAGEYVYRYIEDVYDTWFVYTQSGGETEAMFRVEYSLDANGAAQLGTPAACRREVQYVLLDPATIPANEHANAVVHGDVIPLREGMAAPEGKTARIKIIAPGWGSSGYYAAEVLRESGPAAFPVGTHMFWNHPTLTESVDRPERDLTYLSAVTKSVPEYSETDAAGPGLYCDAEFVDAYAPRLAQLQPYIGVSIYAFAEAVQGEAEGRSGAIVERFLPSPFNTIDFVTVPGAGGEIVQLFESLGRDARTVRENHPKNIGPTPKEYSVMKPEEIEAMKAENARLQTEAAKVTAAETENATLKRQVAEAALRESAQTHASEKLAGYEMPQPARDRVRESVAPVFKDENGARVLDAEAYDKALTEAAAREVKFAQEAYGWGTGKVTNGDGGEPEATPTATPSPVVESARAELGLL